jgi:hypothetical protein
VFSVLALSKRRASLYTLPIVVLIGFLLVAGLAAWQRANIVADLTDRVARGEKSEAAAAVRQLAALADPPLAVLVDAAASDKRAIAEAAQVAINRMFDKWQRQVDNQQHMNSVGRQLAELAGELASQRRAFAPADYPWLMNTTRNIVRLANKCPAKKTPFVAMHCDSIMSVVNQGNIAVTMNGDRAESTTDIRPHAIATPAEQTDNRESRQARLEREFSAFSTQPLPKDDARLPAERNALRSDRLDSQPPNELAQGDSPGEFLTPQQMPSPNELGGRPSWSLPIFRILPTSPVNSPATDDGQSGIEGSNSHSNSTAANTAGIRARELFERWQAASDSERPAIEKTLSERGFKHVPAKLVKQYLSADTQDRLRVVDNVLTEPGVDARPWLFLLAEDDDAEVRLMAVTVMATSDDKALIEKAWQVSIHDRDPRIADLAGRLRERRAGTLRR